MANSLYETRLQRIVLFGCIKCGYWYICPFADQISRYNEEPNWDFCTNNWLANSLVTVPFSGRKSQLPDKLHILIFHCCQLPGKWKQNEMNFFFRFFFSVFFFWRNFIVSKNNSWLCFKALKRGWEKSSSVVVWFKHLDLKKTSRHVLFSIRARVTTSDMARLREIQSYGLIPAARSGSLRKPRRR